MKKKYFAPEMEEVKLMRSCCFRGCLLNRVKDTVDCEGEGEA